jgi:DNA invertase Pin-like site-specific DNA recombinase
MFKKISDKKITFPGNQNEFSLISPRVSSDRQVQGGHGLDGQEQRCRKYSDEKGYIYEKTFPDEGISGAILDRPAIKQMLQHIDNNPVKKYIVIFDDINRIARDVQVYWAIKKEFESRGVRIESPNFKFEDTPEGKFIETILAGKATKNAGTDRARLLVLPHPLWI